MGEGVGEEVCFQWSRWGEGKRDGEMGGVGRRQWFVWGGARNRSICG